MIKKYLPLLFFLFFSCSGKPLVSSDVNESSLTKPYKVMGKWYYPIYDASGYRERGNASWYGPGFHGKKTASGEKYNMNLMTAAHKTLPFNTLVNVRNIENNKSVVVKINDRGPFVKGRIIDLSSAAAKSIGLDIKGVGPVEVSALKPGKKEKTNLKTGLYSVQFGAFSNKQSAELLKDQLRREGHKAYLFPYEHKGRLLFRVRVLAYTSLKEAESAEKKFRKQGYKDAIAVEE